MFYALAGGAILYVIGEIWTGMRRYGHHTLGLYLIAGGLPGRRGNRSRRVLWRGLKRRTGLEPATSSLGSSRSTN